MADGNTPPPDQEGVSQQPVKGSETVNCPVVLPPSVRSNSVDHAACRRSPEAADSLHETLSAVSIFDPRSFREPQNRCKGPQPGRKRNLANPMSYEAGDRNGQVTRFGEYRPGERRFGLLSGRGSPQPFGYNLWKQREFPAVSGRGETVREGVWRTGEDSNPRPPDP